MIMSRPWKPWLRKNFGPKTGPTQNNPLKPGNPCLTRFPAGIKGRLCLDRRPDFNSRASQVQCGFNRSDRKARNPKFRVFRVLVWGCADIFFLTAHLNHPVKEPQGFFPEITAPKFHNRGILMKTPISQNGLSDFQRSATNSFRTYQGIPMN